MNKSQRKVLAEMVFSRIRELNLPYVIDGDWLKFTDPKSVPTGLLTDAARCPKELIAIIKEEHLTSPPSLSK